MIQAIQKNIIVKPLYKEKKIIITTETEKPIYWEVITIGDEVKEIKIGDKIYIDSYGLIEIDKENKLFVASSDNVKAKIID